MSTSKFLRFAYASLTLLLASPAVGADLIVDNSGKLAGADAVNVNGTLYDVSFIDATCAVAFAGCSESNFAFTTSVDAAAAAEALLDQVFLDGMSGQFDTNPAQTLGCYYPGYCIPMVPYMVDASGDTYGEGAVNFAPGYGTDIVEMANYPANWDTAGNNETVWAKFEPVGAVPEPSTWVMMLLGFGAVGGAMRRNRRLQLQRGKRSAGPHP